MERRFSLSTTNLPNPIAESTCLNGSISGGSTARSDWFGHVSPQISPKQPQRSNSSLYLNNAPGTPTRNNLNNSSSFMSPTRQKLNLSHIDPRIYADANSSGLVSRVVKYHESNNKKLQRSMSVNNLYNKPGQFPVVHLKKKPLQFRATHHNVSMTRIAPPERALFCGNTLSSLLRSNSIVGVQKTDEELSCENRPILHPPPTENEMAPTRSVLEVLKEISRKRINTSDVELCESSKKSCNRNNDDLIDAPTLSAAPLPQTFNAADNLNSLVAASSYKRQRELAPPHVTQTMPAAAYASIQTSPEQVAKRRQFSGNNDITSSLSSSLIFNHKRKMYEKSMNETRAATSVESSPENDVHVAKIQRKQGELHFERMPKVSSNSYVPITPIPATPYSQTTALYGSKSLAYQAPESIATAAQRAASAPMMSTSSNNSNNNNTTLHHIDAQKPKLTLFNKNYNDNETIIPERNIPSPDLDTSECAGINFVKPKKLDSISTGKNPIIERIQKNKLALMLSGLRGELYMGDELDELDGNKTNKPQDVVQQKKTSETATTETTTKSIAAATSIASTAAAATAVTTTATTTTTANVTPPTFSFGLQNSTITTAKAQTIITTTSTATITAPTTTAAAATLTMPSLPAFKVATDTTTATSTMPSNATATTTAATLTLPKPTFSFGTPTPTATQTNVPGATAATAITTTAATVPTLNLGTTAFSFGNLTNPANAATTATVSTAAPVLSVTSTPFTANATTSATPNTSTLGTSFKPTTEPLKAFSFGTNLATTTAGATTATTAAAANTSAFSFTANTNAAAAVIPNNNVATKTLPNFGGASDNSKPFSFGGIAATAAAPATTTAAIAPITTTATTTGTSQGLFSFGAASTATKPATTTTTTGGFSFAGAAANTTTTATTVPKQTNLFIIGADSKLAISNSTALNQSANSANLFSFGQKPAAMAAPFSFGGAGASAAANANNTNNVANGNNSNTAKAPEAFSFVGGASNSLAKPVATANSTTNLFAFGANTNKPTTTATVAASNTANATNSIFGNAAANTGNTQATNPNAATTVFSFGGGGAAATQKPATFGSNASSTVVDNVAKPATTTPFTFGGGAQTNNQSTSGGFSFGATANKPAAAAATTSNIFGQATAATALPATTGIVKPSFNFGGSTTTTNNPTNNNNNTSTFGGLAAAAANTTNNSFNFSATKPAATATGGFAFGNTSTPVATNNSAAAPFSFGGAATTAATVPATPAAAQPFTFGGAAAATSTPAAAPAAAGNNMFGSPQANKPIGAAFTFGANAAAAVNTAQTAAPPQNNIFAPGDRPIRRATRRLQK